MGIFYARAIAVVLLVIIFVTWLYRLLFTLNERRINKIEAEEELTQAHESAVGFANSVIAQHEIKLPDEKFVPRFATRAEAEAHIKTDSGQHFSVIAGDETPEILADVRCDGIIGSGTASIRSADRNEVRAKALEIAQEYAKNNFDYVNSDVINLRLIELGYPTLGKYAGGFFRNRKLFATTGLFDRSKMPSAHGRTIQFYRYVGQQAN